MTCHSTGDRRQKQFSTSIFFSFAILLMSTGLHAAEAREEALEMEHVIVTSTREAKAAHAIPEASDVILEEELRFLAPSHPEEALNRVPGVHINNLGGEGHMASIRQPITTSGVYLFLEDGLPTRPTGFFNHNGLYEINIPQASRVEVIKGPASALYGSDAIGGVINSMTKPAPLERSAELRVEAGENGWKRALVSVGDGGANHSGKVDFNLTKSHGIRDAGDYSRRSLTGRLDGALSERSDYTIIAAWSDIDQSGVSGLERDDYRNDPSKNLYHGDIGFREVEAFRLSATINLEIDEQQLLTLTPFYRNNSMRMMPSWMITYDPNIRYYQFESVGAQLKYRFRNSSGVEVITGIDIDSTPSEYREQEISVSQDGEIYTDYALTGDENYRFEATQTSVSPYVQVEFEPVDNLQLSAGVRYDHFRVDYDNELPGDPADFSHRRPDSEVIDYEQSSPKLGLVYGYGEDHSVYVNHRYAFRAPTVGSLFRPGSSRNSTELEPVRSRSSEIGFRGRFGERLSYELAYYDMTVEDDIVSIINGGSREIVNAGETSHRGLELGLDYQVSAEWQLGLSYTETRQKYEDFSFVLFSRGCFCNQQINFAGNDVKGAPERLANLRLRYTPGWVNGLDAELEWNHVGAYYTDSTNDFDYGGHDLLNLRLRYALDESRSVYARLANLTDRRYSTYTSNQVNDPDLSYRPGPGRSLVLGFDWTM